MTKRVKYDRGVKKTPVGIWLTPGCRRELQLLAVQADATLSSIVEGALWQFFDSLKRRHENG